MPLCSKNDVQCRERIMSGRVNGGKNRKLSTSVKLPKINMDICLPRGSNLKFIA